MGICAANPVIHVHTQSVESVFTTTSALPTHHASSPKIHISALFPIIAHQPKESIAPGFLSWETKPEHSHSGKKLPLLEHQSPLDLSMA